jgi:hypothetical protein
MNFPISLLSRGADVFHVVFPVRNEVNCCGLLRLSGTNPELHPSSYGCVQLVKQARSGEGGAQRRPALFDALLCALSTQAPPVRSMPHRNFSFSLSLTHTLSLSLCLSLTRL